MRNKDNDCIRYLMKEMDPSEELLMERAMMEDEDLLIEVESMRQTLQKVDKLPEVEPPSEVTDSIMEQAAEQAEKNRKASRSFIPSIKYAVAATLALTVTAGGMLLYPETENREAQVERSTPTMVSPSQVFTDIAGIQMSSDATGQEELSASSSEPTVEPWVDRNDVLKFEDRFSSQDSDFQAIMQNSTDKLRPLDHPTQTNSQVNSIQLTGSGN